MKAEIKIYSSLKEPYAVIYTDQITAEVTRIIEAIRSSEEIITVKEEDKISILKPDEIYMVRVEEGKIYIYGREKRWGSNKRLYEMKEQLGAGFMQIAKACIINLSYMDSVETSFGGMMKMRLKNGLKEYVSRRYLPGLKEYLGI